MDISYLYNNMQKDLFSDGCASHINISLQYLNENNLISPSPILTANFQKFDGGLWTVSPANCTSIENGMWN